MLSPKIRQARRGEYKFLWISDFQTHSVFPLANARTLKELSCPGTCGGRHPGSVAPGQ